MRRHLLLVVAGCLLIATAGRAEDKAKKAQDSLAGTWDVVAVERDGERMTNKEVKHLQMIFTDKKLTLNKAEKASFDALYTLDPDKDPKTMTVKFLMGPDEGKTFKGIFSLSKGRLTICWSESGVERPTSFTTREKSGRTMYILKRAKTK